MTLKLPIVLLIALLGAIVPLNAQWVRVGPFGAPVITYFFENNGVLFAGSQASGIFRSTDNGSTWSNVSTEITRSWAMVAQGGYLITTSDLGGIYRSTDNGLTWNMANSGVKGTIMGGIASVGNTLIVSVAQDGLYRSTDSATTWEFVSDSGISARVVKFLVHGSCLYAGTFNGVYCSTDLGDSWTQLKGTSGLQAFALATLNDVLFIQNNAGAYRWSPELDTVVQLDLEGLATYSLLVSGSDIFAGVGNASILHSIDTGATWRRLNTDGLPPASSVLSMAVIDGVLYAGTVSYGIWRRSLSEALSDVNDNSIASQSALSALWVQPNPTFAPATVCFTLGKPALVTLTVYDALGRIIAQPVVEALQESGDHQIVISTDGLAAGVYLCSVKGDGVERTVRFVVVR